MEFLNYEIASNLLSEAAKSDLLQKLFLVGIIWQFMAKKVADHFKALEGAVKSLEKSVSNGAHEIADLRHAVEKNLVCRLESLEIRTQRLEDRVTGLEGQDKH